MKLSVIIPVYRVEDTLQRCVDSILLQDYPDMEIILVDDGSPDNCGAICDSISQEDSRISVIHKENGGLSDARNAGIEKASGEYITFVDSDDTVAEGTYREVMALIGKHPDYDIVEFPVYIFYSSKQQRILNFQDEEYTDANDYWFECKAYNHSYAWNKVYKRCLFNGVRFPKGVLFEDMHTLPQLLGKCRMIATTSKGMYYYYANDKGIVKTVGSERLDMLLEAHIAAMTRFPDYDTEYLMQVVNIQLDVYRINGQIQLNGIDTNLIEYRGLPLSQKLKAFILKLFGIRTLCRIHKTVKSLS